MVDHEVTTDVVVKAVVEVVAAVEVRSISSIEVEVQVKVVCFVSVTCFVEVRTEMRSVGGPTFLIGVSLLGLMSLIEVPFLGKVMFCKVTHSL